MSAKVKILGGVANKRSRINKMVTNGRLNIFRHLMLQPAYRIIKSFNIFSICEAGTFSTK